MRLKASRFSACGIMGYSETKVYFDGSHYIAIPHTERPPSRKPKKIDIEDISPIKQSSEENKTSELLPVPRNDGKLLLEVFRKVERRNDTTTRKAEGPNKLERKDHA